MKYSIEMYAPKVLPIAWATMNTPINLQTVYGKQVRSYLSANTMAHLTVDYYSAGGTWLHLSVSCMNRIPSWDELKEAKELFLGDRLAVQVLPPKEYYVNVQPNVLHLFSRLDKESIPSELWKQET